MLMQRIMEFTPEQIAQLPPQQQQLYLQVRVPRRCDARCGR